MKSLPVVLLLVAALFSIYVSVSIFLVPNDESNESFVRDRASNGDIPQPIPVEKENESPKKRSRVPGEVLSSSTLEKTEKEYASLSAVASNILDKPNWETYQDSFLDPYGFNVPLSNHLALDRVPPDLRYVDGCMRQLEDFPTSELPSTSVIITFHNEVPSTLLRSVYSVFKRSPQELLMEIILVDDLSDNEEFLAYYEKLRALPKVILTRTADRAGLIRARLHGAALARGDVLTFLDSHIEAADGWLEPLLARIADFPKRVASPVINIINFRNFEWVADKSAAMGIFNWDMIFQWEYPDEPRIKKDDLSLPFKTPTIAGGLFAIDREWFYESGSYDEAMEIWGGENIEMSFRIWMCGGDMEIVPCSHVGHVFREKSPIKMGANTLYKNTRRVAEVWMDEYKSLYYDAVPRNLPNVNDALLEKRKRLRRSLGCESFDWYMKNVWPEAHVPDTTYVATGEIRNIPFVESSEASSALYSNGLCVDAMGNRISIRPAPYPCHSKEVRVHGSTSQYWRYSAEGEIRSTLLCLGTDSADTPVPMQFVKQLRCTGKDDQLWDLSPDMLSIVQRRSGLCLDVGLENSNKLMVLNTCSPDVETQRWRFLVHRSP